MKQQTQFDPNTLGLMAFFFFLFATWLGIRYALTEIWGDGEVVRFAGVILGFLTIRPLWYGFEKFLIYCYDKD